MNPAWLIGALFKFLTRIGLARWRRLSRRSRQAGYAERYMLIEVSMTFAILKISYNNIGDTTVEGGICGTGFFIKPQKAITANHVLNRNTFTPNVGYKFCDVILISHNGFTYSIKMSQITEYREIDTSVINFDSVPQNTSVYSTSIDTDICGQDVKSYGFIGNQMPIINANWVNNSFKVNSVNLSTVVKNESGHVLRYFKISINGNDVKLSNIYGFEVSFKSVVGMSGGPLIDINGKVIAMLSFGLPADSNVKTQTFAIAICEILSRI